MEIQMWREILDPYYLAVDELTVKFNHIMKEHRNYDRYSPIEQVLGRVKSITSILEKVQKKNISLDDLEERIEDIAGIRIICQFVEDIDKVVAIIRNRKDMRIKSEKDYITNMKESGYRSYHIIIYYEVNTINGPKEIKAEIQIRTLAMNFWATIEHSLQYKYKGNMPEHIKERLSNASEAIIVLDEATASVDVQTEREIQKAVSAISGKHTIFAIAHRLSTIRKADLILVIKDGKIAERGTHDALVAAGGIYAAMNRLQDSAAI